MANDAKSVGCSSNKTILVDPNMFDGHSSTSNISVPLEDLSISVQLETSKKARTVLSTNKAAGVNKSVGESSQKLKVTFIEGSEINGKKVLTTKFTDLTTNFSDASDGENLGITDIQIDFSTSYTPMITIQFIDLRGSAIFQNEEKITKGKNKYATFFQLPYPIFSLTIKGYYGQPVRYCLHMTKMTSKFNSQTGNFEITCNFVGYTYAMLSDMLMGYLKAIPYTKEGGDKYEELKKINPDLLTINELTEKINQINENAKKLKANNPNSEQLSIGLQKLNDLGRIRTTINVLGNDIDLTGGLESYPFIVSKVVEKATTQYNQAQIPFGNSAPIYSFNDNDKTESAKIKKYNDDITVAITTYNDGGSDFAGYTLDLNVFLFDKITSYEEVTPNMINPNVLSADPIRAQVLLNKGFKREDLYKTRETIYNHLISVEKEMISDDINLNIYDLTLLYAKINEAEDKIKAQQKKLEEALAQTLKSEISNALGFDSSIRNIIEIFTTAVEVWLEVLYDISMKADANPNTKRTIQLQKWKGDSYDYKDDAIGNTPNNSAGADLELKYYPWPDYRKKSDDKDGYVETYLGKPGELAVPKDVTELEFIDRLLVAFLDSKAAEDQSDIKALENTSNWAPVNPLDSRLFDETYPYRRIKGDATRDQLITLMLIRAMIFMGYSNSKLTIQEIQTMAKLEGEAVLRDTPNANIKQTFSNLTIKDFTDIQSNYDKDSKIIKPLTSDGVAGYYYNYIYGDNSTPSADDSKTHKLLPINHTFDKEWGTANKPEDGKLLADDGRLFLSNYKTKNVITDIKTILGTFTNNPDTDLPWAGDELKQATFIEAMLNRPNDGGVYVKFFSQAEYDGGKSNPIIGSNGSDTAIDYTIISKPDPIPLDGAGVGFNMLGGNYGQEYRKMKWGDDLDKNGGLPFRYMFYSNVGTHNDGKHSNYSNGLGSFRSASGPNETTMTTNFDINHPNQVKTIIPKDLLTLKSAINGADGNVTHINYGLNRDLGTNITQATYPYVNFNVVLTDVTGWAEKDELVPISLFGSRFYNAQTKDETKAFLFLHTFPWQGLVSSGGFSWYKLAQNRTIMEVPAILNILGNRAGIVSMPKLWPAFIGGLLWRIDTRIGETGGSGPEDPIIWTGKTADGTGTEFLIPTITDIDHVPNRYQYLTPRQNGSEQDVNIGGFQETPMCFNDDNVYLGNYKEIDVALIAMPDQAKIEFKKQFYDFVNGADWAAIKDQHEIFSGTDADWVNTYITTINGLSGTKELSFNNSVLKSTYNKVGEDGNLAFDNLSIFAPIPDHTKINEEAKLKAYIPPIITIDSLQNSVFRYNYVLELKDESPAAKTMVRLFDDEVLMVNTSYKIWRGNDKDIFSLFSIWKDVVIDNVLDIGFYEQIFVESTDLQEYLTTLITTLQPAEGGAAGEKKQALQSIFATADEDIIKLQLYRTCKHTYDKWIGGAEDKNIIFQCGGRNSLDYELAMKYGNNTPKLIDSFRFVDRSFADIGDKLIINPMPISNFIYRNPNSSFYELVSQILGDNYFNFIPLPSYINYKNDAVLHSMFRPMEMYDEQAQKQLDTGPAFVCVYIGQSSMHLDSSNSDYPNDGFDIRCNSQGKMMYIPDDLSASVKTGENYVATFAVNYGQQNQNIFKDITLDQSEHTETAESLIIMDDISKKGAENNRTLAGQNLYNVWAVRSYKTEIEMMGNAMVQPMMYFQLNNIPMFHGAYMIIKVKHSIKPNSMSTNFTGVRIRAPKTELMDVGVLYMSLLASLEGGRAGGRIGNSNYGGSLAGIHTGVNCGEANIPNIGGDVTNNETFGDTKPIRDMIAKYESGSCDKNYNAYNYRINGKLRGVLPCDNGNKGPLYPLTMTIQEIQDAQKDGRMSAVGKYQFIRGTFSEMVKALNLQPTDLFDETNQERAGEWLLKVVKKNLRKYWESDGNEDALVNAISDLAEVWASLPSYHGIKINDKGDHSTDRSIIIGFNSNTAVYGGVGGNLGNSKCCAQDVADRLIQTWVKINKGKTPAFGYDKVVAQTGIANANPLCDKSSTPMNLDVTSTAVIMGDSSIRTYAGAPNSLKENGVSIGFNCAEKTVPWLVSVLTKDGIDKTYPNVRIIYLSIGTNDGYKPNKIKELDDLITKKFPNVAAKDKMVLPGSLGWGYNCASTGATDKRCFGSVNKTKADQNTYYANFTALGWNYPYPATASAEMTDKSAHNSTHIWTTEIVDIIRANQKNNATLLASKISVVASTTPPKSMFDGG